MSNTEAYRKTINENKTKAEELLKQVVNVNSYSTNKPGTDQVGCIFKQWFENLGLQSRTIPRKEVGDILVLSNRAYDENGRGGFLFLCHMDTVFPPDGEIIKFHTAKGVYRGNGVTDDKGGAVITWQALNALKQADMMERFPIRVMLTSDEEIGSPNSKDVIMEEGEKADLVFIMEYGKPRHPGATIVTSRLGRGVFELDISGRKAESAMLEIMEKSYFMASPESQRIIRIRDYIRQPDRCRSKIVFGYLTDAEGDFLLRMLGKIIRRAIDHNDVRGDVKGYRTRPPLLFTEKHWNMVEALSDVAEEVGFKLYHENRMSCSDGSYVPANVPVLDGMGPIGDYVHTGDEYMTLESLTMRPLLTAAMMERVGKSFSG